MNHRLGRLLRRGDLVTVFVMVFMADVAIGLARATFSLHATSLGASLTMVGALGGIEGLVRILVSLPIGSLSDRGDRRTVMSGGLLLFAATYLLFALVRNPYVLFPIRALMAVAIASTFFIGIAYVSDIVDRSDQGLAIGFYTACMGLGFAVGSAVGGWVAEVFGYSVGFLIAAGSMVASFVFLRLGTPSRLQRIQTAAIAKGELVSAKLALLVRDPLILAACLGNLLVSVTLEGTIFNFFPLYAASLFIGEAAIGSMLSARALCSTAARLPAGALTGRISSRHLMVAALILSMISVTTISFATDPAILSLLLACEGIGYGIYFAAGHTTVAEHTAKANRGIATGLYVTAGSVGTAFGPMVMGPVADHWGLTTVFWLTGVLLLAGIGVVIFLNSRRDQRALEHAETP